MGTPQDAAFEHIPQATRRRSVTSSGSYMTGSVVRLVGLSIRWRTAMRPAEPKRGSSWPPETGRSLGSGRVPPRENQDGPLLAGKRPPEGNDKCLEYAESWPSSVTSVRAGACNDATALPCCGHRFSVADIGPPLDHLHVQPDAATDSCKQLTTRPTRTSVYRQPFERCDGKRVMPSSIETFTVRSTVKSFHCTSRQIACAKHSTN